MNRPRCPRGHWLPATGPCRCTLPRPATAGTNRDLRGQHTTVRRLRATVTIQPTGSYL